LKVHEDSKKLSVEELAQHASSKSSFNPEVDAQTGTTPTRIAGWSITAYLITVAVTGHPDNPVGGE
jgi:hypothetical protein